VRGSRRMSDREEDAYDSYPQGSATRHLAELQLAIRRRRRESRPTRTFEPTTIGEGYHRHPPPNRRWTAASARQSDRGREFWMAR
jgi:hypothetical protein